MSAAGDGELPFGDDDTGQDPAGPPRAENDGLRTPGRGAQDPGEGARLRDEAIERVSRRPETPTLLDAVQATARRMGHLTGDDVWTTMTLADQDVTEGRALGAAMRAAQKAGWIIPTDRYIPSMRPEAHRGPKRVWRSTIVEP